MFRGGNQRIGILALLGAIVGYAVFRSTGWLGTSAGLLAGLVVGLAIYAAQTRKAK